MRLFLCTSTCKILYQVSVIEERCGELCLRNIFINKIWTFNRLFVNIPVRDHFVHESAF